VNGVLVTSNPFSISVPLSASAVFNPITALITTDDPTFTSRDRVVVIRGQSVVDGAYSPQGVALRINDSGFHSIEGIVPTLVNFDIGSLVPIGTNLINECFLGFICVSASIEHASIGTFGISIDSMNGFVAGDITVNNLDVVAHITGAVDCHLEISANQAFINGDYDLIPQAGSPSNIDVNEVGDPAVSFSGFNNHFVGGGACTTPVIGDIISAIVGNLESTVHDAFANFLKDPDGGGPQDSPIASALQTALANISITGPISSAIGVNIESPFFPNGIAEDNNGVTFGSDVRITTTTHPAGAPDFAASYHLASTFPSLGPTTPVSLQAYDVGLGISISGFNQLFKAEVENGLLSTELSQIDLTGTGAVPITGGLLSILIPEFGNLDPSLPLRIKLVPTIAPIATGNPGPHGELLEFKIAQLVASIVSGPSASETTYLQLAADVRAGINLTFDSVHGQLVFALTQPSANDITVAVLNNQTSPTWRSCCRPCWVRCFQPWRAVWAASRCRSSSV